MKQLKQLDLAVFGFETTAPKEVVWERGRQAVIKDKNGDTYPGERVAGKPRLYLVEGKSLEILSIEGPWFRRLVIEVPEAGSFRIKDLGYTAQLTKNFLYLFLVLWGFGIAAHLWEAGGLTATHVTVTVISLVACALLMADSNFTYIAVPVLMAVALGMTLLEFLPLLAPIWVIWLGLLMSIILLIENLVFFSGLDLKNGRYLVVSSN